MPATFVVEDGHGLVNATSLTSVAFADDYVANFATTSQASAWAALDTAGKQDKLRRGTQYMELMYADRWMERRTSQLQALSWPRAYMEDRDGFPISANEIPTILQQATVEAALRVMTDDDVIPDLDEPGRIASESVTAGPVQNSVTYVGGGKSQVKKYTKIDKLISLFLEPTRQLYRD